MSAEPAKMAAHDARAARLAIVVVGASGDAELARTLVRVPEEVRPRVAHVYVLYAAAPARVPGLPPSQLVEGVVSYGDGLKRAYAVALDDGCDAVATLHANGQYPPEALPAMLALIEGGADAVFGTRAIEVLRAVEGGTPLYKYVGNRVLTTLENALARTPLSELHSGFRLITAGALRAIPFAKNTDDWHFDTQVILQLHAARLALAEVPIGTYASDEIGVVNGLAYAAQVARSVVDYKLHEVGLRQSPVFEVRATYVPKKSRHGSHARLIELLPPSARRVLDIGAGTGELSSAIAARGHLVTAIDQDAPRVCLADGAEFVAGDLSRGIPLTDDRQFDAIVLADVLEHLPDPERTLRAALKHLTPHGCVLVSLPNAVHWSVRAQLALGRFEYTNRGILDRGHLRFFTERTARRLFRDVGLGVERHVTTPVPWENVFRRHAGSSALTALELLDGAACAVRPNLFAYQHIFRLTRVGVP